MLVHQKASEIEVGDQLFYKFHRYQVTEVLALNHCVRLVGVGERGALYVVLSIHRKLWTLKKRKHHDPLHGLRGRDVPVWRRPELPELPRNQHLPVVSRNQVAEPGALVVRELIGPRIRSSFRQASNVPYVLSVDGSPLIVALHSGRYSGFGAEWRSGETLGQGPMVPDLRAALPDPQGRQTVGCDRPADGRAIRIVIPL